MMFLPKEYGEKWVGKHKKIKYNNNNNNNNKEDKAVKNFLNK